MSEARLFTAHEAVRFLEFLLSLRRLKKRIRRMSRCDSKRSTRIV